MEALATLFRTFARRSNAIWWIGARPEGRDGQLGRLIVAKADLPNATGDPLTKESFVRLDRGQAAQVLARIGTMGLAYPRGRLRQRWIDDAAQALGSLDEEAVFLTDSGSTRLTAFTFESGVLGYDTSTAFIFWAVDED